MTAAAKPFNADGKNSQIYAPPGVYSAALTAAAGIKYLAFANYTQYIHVHNTGAGILRIGFNAVAGKGIDGATAATQCHYKLPSAGILAVPVQASRIFFKAEADTSFSFFATLSEMPCGAIQGGSELMGSENFDLVEELNANWTDFI